MAANRPVPKPIDPSMFARGVVVSKRRELLHAPAEATLKRAVERAPKPAPVEPPAPRTWSTPPPTGVFYSLGNMDLDGYLLLESIAKALDLDYSVTPRPGFVSLISIRIPANRLRDVLEYLKLLTQRNPSIGTLEAIRETVSKITNWINA